MNHFFDWEVIAEQIPPAKVLAGQKRIAIDSDEEQKKSHRERCFAPGRGIPSQEAAPVTLDATLARLI